MKKKMGILGGLMMAVVVTGYSVAGTYAKYTSSLDFADEARVATWEFKLNGQTTTKDLDINLFAESYEVSTDMSAKDKGDVATDVVSSEEGVKVVAPGTRGTYTFNLTGTAETNYTVAFDAVLENTIKTDDYNPIFFRLNNGEWMNAEAFQTYLNTTIKADTNKVYAANYNLNETYTIDWMWAFDKEDASQPEGTGFVSDDVKDTYLAGQNGTVSLNVTLTVTQSELEATEKAPVTPVVPETKFDATISDADKAVYASWGYDETKTAAVTFDGTAIAGTIEKNDSATLAGQYPEAIEQSGYYYPIHIKADASVTEVKVTNNATGVATAKTIALTNGEESIMVALVKSENVVAGGEQSITIEAGEKTYTISYAGLNFAE